ncbi:MAG: hypothetical protein IKP40_00445 [Clostridia bacterium]|nr:hypothetical protein [Clostridia bacterium]
MDIEMPMLDGMEAAREFRQTDEHALLVFITNLASYAIHGYEVQAFDYNVTMEWTGNMFITDILFLLDAEGQPEKMQGQTGTYSDRIQRKTASVQQSGGRTGQRVL